MNKRQSGIVKALRLICVFVIIALALLLLLPHTHTECEDCILCEMKESFIESFFLLLIFAKVITREDKKLSLTFLKSKTINLSATSPIERADKLSN